MNMPEAQGGRDKQELRVNRGMPGTSPVTQHPQRDAFGTVRAALYLTVIVALFVSGCSALTRSGDGGGKLAIQDESEQGAVLRGGFDSGIYRFHNQNNLVVLLFDGPQDDPTQVVILRMFWWPRAGQTPIDPTATNASVHYIIFAGEQRQEVGIYSGAGFVYPTSRPGGRMLKAGVWHAHLRLVDSSDGFTDRLGQAVLKGKFQARRDELALEPVLHRLNVLIQNQLGYPRLVRTDAQFTSPLNMFMVNRPARHAAADVRQTNDQLLAGTTRLTLR
jgi:hypothetical protein